MYQTDSFEQNISVFFIKIYIGYKNMVLGANSDQKIHKNKPNLKVIVVFIFRY